MIDVACVGLICSLFLIGHLICYEWYIWQGWTLTRHVIGDPLKKTKNIRFGLLQLFHLSLPSTQTFDMTTYSMTLATTNWTKEFMI